MHCQKLGRDIGTSTSVRYQLWFGAGLFLNKFFGNFIIIFLFSISTGRDQQQFPALRQCKTLAEIMTNLKHIFFIILLHPIVTFGQISKSDSNKIHLHYDDVKYEIINIDTAVSHYVDGKYNKPNFKAWDSTKIWADIILLDLPAKINLPWLKRKVEEIMKDKGINKAFIFRDRYSSMLFRLSSLYAAKKLKEIDGYLGQYNMN
jgi:hypothetical protein